MPFTSDIFPSDSFRENLASEGKGSLVKQICRASEFLRSFRIQMRFGELSRAPLRFIRLQILDNVAECDWLARPPDPWDADLPLSVQQQHASLQSLRDGIDVRALLFDLMPQLETAHLRAYRESANYEHELIIEGCAQRSDNSARNLHSLVMRAKILGFRFDIDGNELRSISALGIAARVGSWKAAK